MPLLAPVFTSEIPSKVDDVDSGVHALHDGMLHENMNYFASSELLKSEHIFANKLSHLIRVAEL